MNGAMDASAARNLAYALHAGMADRSGEPFVEHLERVAASVPPEARTVAYLHDVLEHTDTSIAELETEGLTQAELEAVRLLTRPPDESFEAHALRISHARGPAGRLARAVKLADIEDHMSHAGNNATHRPYAWAWRHVAAGRDRFDRPSAPLPSVA